MRMGLKSVAVLGDRNEMAKDLCTEQCRVVCWSMAYFID